MSRLGLAPSLSFCSIDGRTLFLDIERNRYFGLPPSASAAFHSLRKADGEETGIERIDELFRLGIVRPVGAGGQDIEPARIAVPAQSLIEQETSPASFGPLAEIGIRIWITRRRIAHGRLPALIVGVKAGRRDAAQRSGVTADLVARFRAARRLIPVQPNCLLDSIALLHFLVRRGARADLVFGVRLDPFSAHCWLQNSEWIISDPAENCAGFTPILVV